MAEKTISIRNDVPEEFLKLFADNGPFRRLSDLARTERNTFDLQFRNTQGAKPWATLYLGTSKVVDIYFSLGRRELKIVPQKSKGIFKDALGEFWKNHSEIQAMWGNWQSEDEAGDSWKKAGDDLIDCLTRAEGRAKTFSGSKNEGYLQAGIAKSGFFDRWALINRESIVSFENDGQRQRTREKVLEPIDEALQGLWSTGHDWTKGKKGFAGLCAEGRDPSKLSGFGNKLDALAVDNAGDLLAIEVKGGYDTAGVGWTPAQVVVYLRLLEQWRARTTENQLEVLERSLKQRRDLGLAGSQMLDANFKIIPVIVIGEISSPKSAKTAGERMETVRNSFDETGDDLKDLRVFQLEGPDLECFEIKRGEKLRATGSRG